MKLTEKQVEDLVWEGEVVKTTEGENRRWSRTITSIVKIDSKYYEIHWDEGLTENNENYYPEQEAIEVKSVEKTIIVKEWIPVKKGN
ncbi:hypothetical protein LCGC14_1896430 [marine sediment metagenome]|uniref:Uncharacterized protein n=1 Tax=marine sediment metagenome TaxID=412755 RepID=A0A0F9GLC1_9ZZZZ